METAQPLLPALSTTTKNRSPKIFNTALMIRKYSGELLSPSALNVLEKKLYKNVNTRPINIILRYCVVILRIDLSTCKSVRIGTANIMHSRLNIIENITPEIIVVLI